MTSCSTFSSLLVSIIKLLLDCFGSSSRLLFSLEILALEITVVEIVTHVLVIVDPCADHMRVLFVEVHCRGCAVEQHWLVIANLIGCEGSWSIEKVLSP